LDMGSNQVGPDGQAVQGEGLDGSPTGGMLEIDNNGSFVPSLPNGEDAQPSCPDSERLMPEQGSPLDQMSENAIWLPEGCIPLEPNAEDDITAWQIEGREDDINAWQIKVHEDEHNLWQIESHCIPDAPGTWNHDAGTDWNTDAWERSVDTWDQGDGWEQGAMEANCDSRWKDGQAAEGRSDWGEGTMSNQEGGRSLTGRGKGRGRKQEREGADAQRESTTSSTEAQGGLVGYTTVMLRNIPNKYTREMLVKQLNQDFRGEFDFVYLPIDFKNRCNVGYGFINFRTVEACDTFVTKFNGVDVRKCLPGLNSRKVAEVTPARVQGLDENVRRLRNSPVMNELAFHPEWMPLLLDKGGEETPFPMPEQPCPPVKPRRRGREERG